MKKILIAATILLTSSIQASASTPNGAEILRSCSMSAKGSADDQNCSAFINGLMAGILIDQIANEQRNPVCLPKKAETDLVRKKIYDFLRTHPQALLADGNAAVGVALIDALPCTKTN